ncbi:MAG: 2-C-methyl-D-erythritol 4-phosphate cytidylyltransferase [Nocardioides sp.]
MDQQPRHALLVLAERADLVFHELHREPLYVHGLRALGEAAGHVVVSADPTDVDRVRDDLRRLRLRADVVAGDAWWDGVQREPGRGLVVHDALCPLVDRDFVGSVLQRADDRPTVSFVAIRVVTDTLKAVVDGQIQGTIDRERVATVTSPAVIAPDVLRGLDDPPPVHAFAELVVWLRQRGLVELVKAPSLGRRIEDARSVRLLESLDEVGHRVRAVRVGSVPEDRA